MHDNKRTGYDKTVRNPRPRTLKRKNPEIAPRQAPRALDHSPRPDTALRRGRRPCRVLSNARRSPRRSLELPARLQLRAKSRRSRLAPHPLRDERRPPPPTCRRREGVRPGPQGLASLLAIPRSVTPTNSRPSRGITTMFSTPRKPSPPGRIKPRRRVANAT